MKAVTLVLVVVVLAGIVALVAFAIQRNKVRAEQRLADAMADARRWYERLGGQVLNLTGDGNPAAQQALSDAAERYNAAGSQLEQARTPAQAGLARQTALEGLYYVGAARSALGLDPGPELPPTPGQQAAGQVTESREVAVEDHRYVASPQPSDRTTHYYPGGVVAGRPVPRGWYSEPFWKPALIGGAWGIGSALLFGSLFGGMAGVGWGGGWGDGDNNGDGNGDNDGGDGGDGGDDFSAGDDFSGGDSFGDFGGGDFGGGDF
jgi:hypothetical protein